MLKTLIRAIADAFAQGFAMLAKLPPQAFRQANYPF
jgi:hypothetical protein